MTLAQEERRAIVAAMRAAGPDAPTLCGEWTVRDLAAHLIVRERRPDAAPGIMLPGLDRWTRRVQNGVAGRDWEAVLAELAAGPPAWSPFRWADAALNSAEMFVHHEDVRRAQPDWRPRELDAHTQRALSRLLSVARFTYRAAPVRVELATPGGRTVVARARGPRTVRLTGEPSELLLHAYGRNAVVLDAAGDSDDIVALHATPRKI